MEFCCCPQLAIPLKIFRISKVSWIRIYIQEGKTSFGEEKKYNIYDFCKHTNTLHLTKLILMWMPMQGIKFRDFMSTVVCTSNRNDSPASAKLNKGKNCFALKLVLVSKWE